MKPAAVDSTAPPRQPRQPRPGIGIAVPLAWFEAILGGLLGLLLLVATKLDLTATTVGVILMGAAIALGWCVQRFPSAQQSDGALDWHPLEVVLAVVGGFVGGQFLGGLLAVLVSIAVPHPNVTVNALTSLLTQIAAYSGMAINLWVFVLARHTTKLADLGWRRPRSWWWLAATPLIAFATLFLASAVTILLNNIFPGSTNPQCKDVRAQYGNQVVLAIVVVSVFAPIAEETFFRGFIFRALRQHKSALFAVIASAAIFSAFHGIPLLFLPLMVVGAVLALVYERSNSIWPGVMVHGMFNLWGVIAILDMSSGC